MSRPMVEITEEMERWARYVAVHYADVARELANAILAAIPQPPRPLAVGDVVDRCLPPSGESPLLSTETVEHVGSDYVVVRRNATATAYLVRRGEDVYPRIRVGEDSPAPWPWTLETER